MDIVDPKKIRLQPGQGVGGIITTGISSKEEMGFVLRSESGSIKKNGDPGIEWRAGVIQFNEILLVLTMLRVQGHETELFDVWWNYHANTGKQHFQRMSEEENLKLYFCNEANGDFFLDEINGFKKFFGTLPNILDKTTPWSEAEFDRAVRGFCAQSYPKENLWEMIRLSPYSHSAGDGSQKTVDDYGGFVPDELRPFYVYDPEQGHCINVVPSTFEDKIEEENPQDLLHPAPIRTVMRGGVRWINGYPVAAIPYIPGHGLAVPPEDSEF